MSLLSSKLHDLKQRVIDQVGDQVVKIDEDTNSVKVYFHKEEEWQQFIDEFMNDPEIDEYGHFKTADEFRKHSVGLTAEVSL